MLLKKLLLISLLQNSQATGEGPCPDPADWGCHWERKKIDKK